MSGHPKSKFTKVKLKSFQAYRETKEQHKKLAPNPRIAKLDQIEKEDVEIALEIDWEYKIDNIREKKGVNYAHIKHTTYDYYD